ncbi:Uncharacterised protein [Vibrio cholerae]|nr:Uncharacterised protein [Vibrio cholerae]
MTHRSLRAHREDDLLEEYERWCHRASRRPHAQSQYGQTRGIPG